MDLAKIVTGFKRKKTQEWHKDVLQNLASWQIVYLKKIKKNLELFYWNDWNIHENKFYDLHCRVHLSFDDLIQRIPLTVKIFAILSLLNPIIEGLSREVGDSFPDSWCKASFKVASYNKAILLNEKSCSQPLITMFLEEMASIQK